MIYNEVAIQNFKKRYTHYKYKKYYMPTSKTTYLYKIAADFEPIHGQLYPKYC